jgi:hypothetical protein
MEPLRSVKNVVKAIEPQGGFRYLSYEYVDQNESRVHKNIHIKSQAEGLEAFFAKN